MLLSTLNNYKYSKKINNVIILKNNNLILYNNLGSFLLNLKKFIRSIKIINNELSINLLNNNSLSFISIFFKNHFKYQFKELIDICTVDYLNYNKNNRFEINYLLLSLKYKTRLKIKLYTDEKMIISSITNIYSSAN